MPVLAHRRIAAIITEAFEEYEFMESLRALRSEGAELDILAPADSIAQIQVDRVLSDSVRADQYDGLLLAGGLGNLVELQANFLALKFIAEIQENEKPVAAIGHAVILLDPATTENRVICRSPAGLPAFISAMISLFAQRQPLISPETRHLFARSRIA